MNEDLLPNTLCTARREHTEIPVRVQHKQRGTKMYECIDMLGNEFIFPSTHLTPVKNTIPSRFSATQFARVAPFLAHAIKEFPKAIVVEPQDVSVESLAHMIRMGRDAKNTYGHKHPLIDESLWNERSPLLIVSIQKNGTVLIGPKSAVDKRCIAKSSVALPRPSQLPGIVIPDADLLEAICLRLNNRTLVGSFLFRGLTEDSIISLESRYPNLVFLPLESDSTLFQIMT